MHRGIRAMIPAIRIVLRASCTVLYLFFLESQGNHLTTMLYKLKLYSRKNPWSRADVLVVFHFFFQLYK